MKSHWIRHNNKRIFIAEFSNFGGDAKGLAVEVEAVKEALKMELPNSVRSITCVDGTFANPEIIQVLGGLLPFSNKYICQRALVGVAGFRKYFLDSVDHLLGTVHFKSFDTLDNALEWISQD